MKSRNNILLTLQLTCIIRKKNGILKYKWECNDGLQWECVSLQYDRTKNNNNNMDIKGTFTEPLSNQGTKYCI